MYKEIKKKYMCTHTYIIDLDLSTPDRMHLERPRSHRGARPTGPGPTSGQLALILQSTNPIEYNGSFCKEAT